MNTNVSEKITTEEKVITNDVNENKKMSNIMYKFIKRTVDICLGIVGMILFIPLTIFIWFANLFAKDNGPVFFVQERIGKNGKLFKLYKYRSMVMGADDKLAKYLAENPEAREEYKKYKKLQEDPRITPIGKFLRKTSLDEFPQFINVMIGQMSIVGPRPYLPREIDDMGDSYNEIIKVKPGLTGLWQVNGRSDTTFENRLIIDKDYIKRKSLILDLKIFIRTFIKVKDGAM